jgi:hypothetical protein
MVRCRERREPFPAVLSTHEPLYLIQRSVHELSAKDIQMQGVKHGYMVLSCSEQVSLSVDCEGSDVDL